MDRCILVLTYLAEQDILIHAPDGTEVSSLKGKTGAVAERNY
jgi:hypothetical protein